MHCRDWPNLRPTHGLVCTDNNRSHVRYTPNGKYILTSSLDSTVRLWNVSSPSKCVKTYRSVSQSVDDDDNDDGQDGWCALSISTDIVIMSRGHKNHRLCIFSAFSLNGADGGKRIISGSEDGHLYVWDLQSRAILRKLQGHTGRSVHVGTCDGWLTERADDSCSVCSLFSLCCLVWPYVDAVISVASHPTDCMIASGGMNEDCTIRLWELGASSSSAAAAADVSSSSGKENHVAVDDMMDESA